MSEEFNPQQKLRVGGEPPTVTITKREQLVVASSNALYAMIGNALEEGVISGLEFQVARTALMLIESIIVRRFSIFSIDDAIEQLNTAVDIYNSFEEIR